MQDAALSTVSEWQTSATNRFLCSRLSHSAKLIVASNQERQVCLYASGKEAASAVFLGQHSFSEAIGISGDDGRVAAGGVSGVVKLWDVGKMQAVGTYTGHKAGISSFCFNPADKFISASASVDTTAKIWDSRAKSAVNTLKIHAKKICQVDFSPDGRWLVTTSDDCKTKIWDIAANKLIAELAGHSSSVLSAHFHPNEYLLATGSQDKTVRFWDLETFECVGQSESDAQPVQHVMFHPSGSYLFACGQANIRLLGYEPTRTFGLAPMPAASGQMSSVAVPESDNAQIYRLDISDDGCCLALRKIDFGTVKNFSVDLARRVDGLNLNDESVMACSAKLRRSFHEKRQQADPSCSSSNESSSAALTSESSASSPTSNESRTFLVASGPPSSQEENFALNYVDAFKAKPKLKRSPTRSDKSGPASSKTNESRTQPSPRTTRKQDAAQTMQMQPTKATKARATVLPLPAKRTESKVVQQVQPHPRQMFSVAQIPSTSLNEETSPDGPFSHGRAHLASSVVNAHEFLPSREIAPFQSSSSTAGQSAVTGEEDCLQAIDKQSSSMHAVMQNRVKSSRVVAAMWRGRGVRQATDTAVSFNNAALLVDLLNVLNHKTNLWSLDLCVMLLPQLKELVSSKYKTHVQTAVQSLRLVLREFSPVIRNGLNVVPSIGVDVTQEERYTKCQKCFVELLAIRNAFLDNKQKLSSSGILSLHTHREICLLMQQLDTA